MEFFTLAGGGGPVRKSAQGATARPASKQTVREISGETGYVQF